MHRTKCLLWVYAILMLAICANAGVWFSVRHERGRWLNVPPVPSKAGALASTLGDSEFAYRFIGLVLQNLGNIGGRDTVLKDYDYNALTRWFYLANSLDSKSNFVPYLAGYYFSAVTPPETMRPMLAYLHDIGSNTEDENWRWLAQAAYLARFNLKDMDLALKYANELAASNNPALPMWVRQMPAYILNAEGNKQAAYGLMLEMLKSTASKLSREEIVNTKYYICQQILGKNEAAGNPLCEGIPPLKDKN